MPGKRAETAILGIRGLESKTVERIGATLLLAAVVSRVAWAAVPGATEPKASGGGAAGVIELFTSQGCPKCPPADRLITDFASRPDVIALSFPVNYWDYSGWKDTLASPAFTQRQHAYAESRGDRLVFTPQFIVDGLGVEPGADKVAIVKATATLPVQAGAMRVPISLSETGGALHIDLGPKPEDDHKSGVAGVYVLRVARAKTVRIERGANSGRSVTYTNVVRAMNRIGDWAGRAAHFDMLELKSDDEGYVVLLQTGTPGKPGMILAAAKTADL